MKKINKLAVLALALGLSMGAVAAFSACNGNTDNSSVNTSVEEKKDYKMIVSNQEVVAFTATTEVMNIAKTTSVYDYMVELQKLGLLTMETSSSEWGVTLDGLNGKKNADDWSTYWGVYTTLGEMDGVIYALEMQADWVTGEMTNVSYTYEGVKYLYAQYGIGGLPVVEGQSYLFHFGS